MITQAVEVADDLKDRVNCVICLENAQSIRFDPCGHVCCCDTCESTCVRCPMCNTDIAQRQVSFI